MHIVINTIPLLSRQTGIGNCIYNISKYLLKVDKVNKYTFYYGYFSDRLQKIPQETEKRPNEMKFNILQKAKPYVKKVPFLGDVSKKVIENWNKMNSYKKKFDICFEPNYIPAGIQANKTVTTVHDFSFHLYPEWHPRDRISYFKKYFFKRIYKSDLITTDSLFIKEEAGQFLKIDENRIKVVPMGYDNTVFRSYQPAEVLAFRNEKKLPEKFILFVGSIEPRKNIERLLSAYLRMPEYVKKEFKLVLAGFSGWRNKKIMSLIDKMKKHVMFLGFLSVRELAMAYNAAKVFAYPSLYEGFGLPPLEAMACGTPVLVSKAASLPEVCGKAALYCDPHDIDDIAEKMERLIVNEDMQERLTMKGRERIKSFTWEATAGKFIKIFEEISV